MKITRERYSGSGGKLRGMAFIRATPWERIALRRMMRAGRHNLRPSRNWPGLCRHGASYVMMPKGAWNPDTGRKPGMPQWLTNMLRHRFNLIDVLSLIVANMMPAWWISLIVITAGAALSLFLQRWKLKNESPYRLHGKTTK